MLQDQCLTFSTIFSQPKVSENEEADISNPETKPRENEKITCDECSRCFTRTGSLMRHKERKHRTAGDPVQMSFSCPICFKVFKGRKDYLTQHLLTHEKGRFACSCGKIYKAKANLKKHTQKLGHIAKEDYQPVKVVNGSSTVTVRNDQKLLPTTGKRSSLTRDENGDGILLPYSVSSTKFQKLGDKKAISTPMRMTITSKPIQTGPRIVSKPTSIHSMRSTSFPPQTPTNFPPQTPTHFPPGDFVPPLSPQTPPPPSPSDLFQHMKISNSPAPHLNTPSPLPRTTSSPPQLSRHLQPPSLPKEITSSFLPLPPLSQTHPTSQSLSQPPSSQRPLLFPQNLPPLQLQSLLQQQLHLMKQQLPSQSPPQQRQSLHQQPRSPLHELQAVQVAKEEIMKQIILENMRTPIAPSVSLSHPPVSTAQRPPLSTTAPRLTVQTPPRLTRQTPPLQINLNNPQISTIPLRPLSPVHPSFFSLPDDLVGKKENVNIVPSKKVDEPFFFDVPEFGRSSSISMDQPSLLRGQSFDPYPMIDASNDQNLPRMIGDDDEFMTPGGDED